MRPPTVSVITPHYNHGRVIGRCVASVAAQTVPILEHVIVDDCSTDGSLAEVKKLAKAHGFVRLLQNSENVGTVIAQVKGFRASRGRYVIFLGADDCLHQEAVESLLAVVQSHPDAAIVCGDIEFADVETGKITRRRFVNADMPTFISAKQLVELYQRCIFVPGCAAMVHRSALHSSVLDIPDLRWHQDNITLTAVALRHGVWYVPEVIHRFQRNGGISNYGRGAWDWPEQRLVIRAFLALLREKSFADLQPVYRRAAFLALFPHALRYVLTQADARPYLTVRLVVNAFLLHFLYALRPYLPARASNWFIWLRGSRLG